ncbi:MAG TPA: DUF4838 domain-containing protein [Chthoniobacteraceae bacterium]|nr:DUF4838 domain-containing protein [Chthoniobacteraceae bacterium]
MILRHSLLLATALALFAFASPDAQSVELIRDGKPQSQIVVAPDALPQVAFAAKELQEHLYKMSGARLEIVPKADESMPHAVYVGESEATRALGLEIASLTPEAYRVVATDRYLALLGHDGTVLPVPRDLKETTDRTRLKDEWQKRTGEKWDMPRNGLYDPRHHNHEVGFSVYDPTGTLFAVYDVLESLGVRWYLPYHEFGTVIPKAATVDLPEQNRTEKPVFGYRHMRWSFARGDLPGFLWFKRQKLGMEAMIWMDHGTINVTRFMDDSHPEYFAVVGGRLHDGGPLPEDGSRRPKHSRSLPRLAPPLADALVRYADFFFTDYPEMTLFPAGPSDAFTSIDDRDVAAGWLREERGSAGRLSDYVWNFVNQVAEGIARQHPGKLVLGLAYSYYRVPPLDLEKFHDNVAIAYCQTRSLQMRDPQERAKIFAEREAWLKKLPSGALYLWEYNLMQLGPGDNKQTGQLRGVPVFVPTILQADLKALAGKARGEFVECAYTGDGKMLAPGINHLGYYIQARLYWNPDLDMEALIDEYCRTFFGPAAQEMKEFYRFAEEVWMRPESRQITLTGGFLRPADVERYFDILQRARAKASGDEAKRIDVILADCQPMKEIFPALQRQGPDFAAPRGSGTPSVDGDLEKPFWSAPAEAPAYVARDLKSGEPVTPETTVRFRWADDDSGLYIGITAREPQMEKLQLHGEALRDSESLYDNDFVELFLETSEHSTFRMVVNAEGGIRDSCTDSRIVAVPIQWDADWTVATRRGKDRWTVELFIPRSSLADAAVPTADLPWGVNICRTRFAEDGKAQNSAISPTGGRFFVTEKFGNLIAAPKP